MTCRANGESDMRGFAAAALLVGALVCSREAEALDCDVPGSWSYQAAEGIKTSEETQRQDREARAVLERLERTPIIFRGRLASARYLSDLRKTNTPYSLLIFDHVEVLRGRLPKALDRKAFIILADWCDFRCHGPAAQGWPRGKAVVVGARPNNLVPPNVVELSSKRVIYKGRIDAVVGVCSGGPLTPEALELLNAPDDEIARLKREYLPRHRGAVSDGGAGRTR
jgi:hypothetical protein